ncbi:helix-turn-helix domain-containing protein [Cesiribacter sp. SM1]|uniref:helix-turn-helix domain-containing protein n=1 Tax=Cesiribacter sp. SM1 TaxID=2861196 RepID=UPI001CD363DA|nr:helix-turn-helix domain-containing protein [Cesiribacter sp. SM1]
MKHFNSNRSETSGSFVLVPHEFIERVEKMDAKVDKLLEYQQKGVHVSPVEEYVPEHEARQALGKGGTWFWEQRKSGALPYTKVGGKVYYRRSDLAKLFDQSSSKS